MFVLKDNLHLFASPLGPSPVSPRCSLAWSRTIAWLAAGDAQQPVAGDATAAARCGDLNPEGTPCRHTRSTTPL